MHKFLKEKNIYSLNANSGDYKYRTVFLTRNAFGATSYNPTGANEFGFNLQTYGLLNSLSKQTEYICFVNNVQPKSSARRAGLNNGDILLAVDNIRIDQFKAFNDIVKHVKGKNELCLVIFPESTCKKVVNLFLIPVHYCLQKENIFYINFPYRKDTIPAANRTNRKDSSREEGLFREVRERGGEHIHKVQHYNKRTAALLANTNTVAISRAANPARPDGRQSECGRHAVEHYLKQQLQQRQ
jgi:hypothetical protein